jgi:hypothetical protein
MNNIFTIKAVIMKEGSYVHVTGEYQLSMIPEIPHFKRGDILTEDKYNGHQIYVSLSGETETGENYLVLDNASQHPDIKKPFTEKLIKDLELGIHLLKQDNGKDNT